VLAAERLDVLGGAVEQQPADPRPRGVPRDALEPVGHARVHQDRRRALGLRGVDEAEQLLDLEHRVVLGEEHLDLRRKTPPGALRILSLECLVLLLGTREAHHDPLAHRSGAYTAAAWPASRPGAPAQAPVLRAKGAYAVGDLRVTGIEGRHANPGGREFGATNTLWLIETGGLRIAHLGDTGPLSEASPRARDLVAGLYARRGERAAQQYRLVLRDEPRQELRARAEAFLGPRRQP